MKIKKGNLNYDQSGRAYPDEPQIKENWDCIWEFEGKHYILVGDDEHKEWEEVNLYNHIIDEAYKNYVDKLSYNENDCFADEDINKPNKTFIPYNQEEFINKIKTNKLFSERWGLTIEEEELGLDERKQIMIDKEIDYVTVNMFFNKTLDRPKQEMYEKTIPTKLITVTYNNETIEVYE